MVSGGADLADQRGFGGINTAAEVFELFDPHDRVAGVVRPNSGGEEFVEAVFGVLECPGGDRVADLGHQHPLGMGITLCLPGDLFVTTKPLTQPRKEHLISISISISISPGTGARTGTGTNRIKGGLRTHDPIMTTGCDNEARFSSPPSRNLRQFSA